MTTENIHPTNDVTGGWSGEYCEAKQMERFSICIPVNGMFSWITAESKADAEWRSRDMHGIPPELEIEVETENEYHGRDEWGAYTDEREPEIE